MRKLKESRALSFAVIAVIYILATIAGVATYKALGFDWWLSLLVADAVANTVLFLAVSIPMADGKQSKKESFAEYKKQTRMLLPTKK